jgi:predicted dithiol-disulfide oxidoreductase (DUF899 family)
MTHAVVSHDHWVAARRELLAREKEFTRLRDELSAARRALPWERVERDYLFEGPNGQTTLSDTFEGRSQLIVYHFMYHPDWDAGCKSCSFWADNFNGVVAHLNQRDVTMIAVSRAPLENLCTFANRMGWSFPWFSSSGSEFNYDFGVSFTADQLQREPAAYNYGTTKVSGPELPGISVFSRDETGVVYHTYSTYGRGLDMLNTAYHYLDLVPKGRDEAGLPYPMAWVRLRDQYEQATRTPLVRNRT